VRIGWSFEDRTSGALPVINFLSNDELPITIIDRFVRDLDKRARIDVVIASKTLVLAPVNR
jgi:hypothetical protein